MKARTASLAILLAVAVLGLFSPDARADIMYYNGMGLNQVVTLHAPGLLGDNLSVYAGQNRLNYQGQDLLGYCVDLNHYAVTADMAQEPVTSLPRGQQVAYLFDTYASQVTTSRQAAALAVAIWELVAETQSTLSATSGYFYITGNSTAASDADALLAGLPTTYTSPSNLEVLYSNSAQCFLVDLPSVTAPEPATVSLLVLGGVALMTRRRK